MWHRLVCASALLALAAPLTMTTVAQTMTPVVPAATACQGVPQRSLVELFTPPSAATASSGAATPIVPSTGEPADATAAEAVVQTTQAVVACLNAGDYWSLVTLVSDTYLRRSFVDGPPRDPLARELAPFIEAVRGCKQCTVAPREGEDLLAIATIGAARMLADGRVGVDLTLSDPAGENPLTLFAAFVATDGRWLVDEIVELAGEGTATP